MPILAAVVEYVLERMSRTMRDCEAILLIDIAFVLLVSWLLFR